MEEAIYVALLGILGLLVGIAVDIAKISKVIQSLKDNSDQLVRLTQKLVDRPNEKEGNYEEIQSCCQKHIYTGGI